MKNYHHPKFTVLVRNKIRKILGMSLFQERFFLLRPPNLVESVQIRKKAATCPQKWQYCESSPYMFLFNPFLPFTYSTFYSMRNYKLTKSRDVLLWSLLDFMKLRHLLLSVTGLHISWDCNIFRCSI